MAYDETGIAKLFNKYFVHFVKKARKQVLFAQKIAQVKWK